MNTTPFENSQTFSSSVNIVRDSDSDLNYIVTPNAEQAFGQIINDFRVGVRSFTIIGAYGVGKSAFLWALEQSISKQKLLFKNSIPDAFFHKDTKFLRIVGEYNSLKATFASILGIGRKDFTVKDVFRALEAHLASAATSSGQVQVIVIDEFGKFLEYAAKNNPEGELFFIQQLAEYANDLQKNVLLITSLHQDFNGYSRSLSVTQQREWDKVKGRLKEITFNEPVEQLLFLASERLPQLGPPNVPDNFQELFEAIKRSRAFPLKDYLSEAIAKRLLPFDILSAAALTLSLQKYGQNERSLFSFIESHDPFGIRDFDGQSGRFYSLANVYDYLAHNYYSFLNTKYNPHYTQWAAIRSAVERTESIFGEEASDALKLVKCIGLLNIFGSAAANVDKSFLTEYGYHSLGVSESDKILNRLEKFKIIRFIRHTNKYILFEGTDLDIELAIDEAGNLVERVSNVVHHLLKYFDFPYIPAKAAFYQKGTPRFFAYHLSEIPQELSSVGEVDGHINLIFSDSVTEKQLQEYSANGQEAVLYGLFKNTDEIRNVLFEIDKIEKVTEIHPDDRVAVRELNAIRQHQIRLLNHYVLESIYTSHSSVVWYFNGTEQKVNTQKAFNQLLSKICEQVYPASPIYKNEMVNKTKLSGALSLAKKNYLKQLVENWQVADLGFKANKFPPEKTVYLSLLRETGIHRKTDHGYTLLEPTDSSFQSLWAISLEFLDSTRTGKRKLNELVDVLFSRPLKLKKGFVDFWLPTFLFCQRNDFALFGRDGYIPTLSAETLDLVSKEPAAFEVKAFDIEGVKLDIFNRYRSLLNQSEQRSPTSATFIETIRPFLTFYRDLPPYTKHTKNLTKKAIALREAIVLSKDPEDTFFDKFPKALGFNTVQLQRNQADLERFVFELESSIREIRTCYEELVNSFEALIINEFTNGLKNFEEYKQVLQTRFKYIKTHLLLPRQRVFLQRVNSQLDDRNAWLSSLAQACIGKSLDTITDNEREVLFDKFKDTVLEMDNLCEISSDSFDEEKEIVLKLEVTSFIRGLKRNLVRLPRSKNEEFSKLQNDIKLKLGGDKQLNIATLTKILEELLQDEE